MQVQIFLELKIPSDAKQTSRKLAHQKGVSLDLVKKYALQTYFKQYGLVTKIVSQYALQPHDCRGRPYWKAEISYDHDFSVTFGYQNR